MTAADKAGKAGKAGTAGGRRRRRRWRWLRRLVLVVVALPVLAVGYPNVAAVAAARGRTFDDPRQVPAGRAGLVFGCDDLIAGRENLYFRYRIDAAAELWRTGRLRCLIVSGDNRSDMVRYNEPQRMKQALVEAGVPAGRIVEDETGVSTLDSVFHVQDRFGLHEVVFISQRFQNQRALYLARARGIDAVAFNARDVAGQGAWKARLREVGARVKMWLDVRVWHTQPKHPVTRQVLPG